MTAPAPSKLDQRQILQAVLDESTGSLRTTSNSTIVNADIDVSLDATEDNDAAWIKDETGAAFTDTNYVPVGQTTHDNLNLNANTQVGNADVGDANPLPITWTGLNPSGATVRSKLTGDEPNNSTTTPLLANATFTGAYTDCSSYACIDISLKANVNSAVGGVKLQFSNDGINVIREQVTTYIAAEGIYASFPTESKYFRFIFINGIVNQTQFTIETHLHINSQTSQVVPIGYPLKDQYSASLSRSVITGKSPDSTYVNLKSPGISVENSTTTLLGIGGVFTGIFQEVLGFSSITVATYANQDSATDGLSFEFSTDGVNIDSTESYSRPANDGHDFVIGISARYFRVKYINGTVAQTIFRLQTLFHIHAPVPHTHKIDEPLTGEHGAALSKSIISGKNELGVFNNVGLSNTNSVKVAITDRPSEVRSRVKIEASIFSTALTGANTVIYTVTSGKILYIESFIVSSLNAANAIGEWRLRDNNTDKIGFLSGEKAIGASSVAVSASPSLPEPIPFTTSVTARSITGTITLSFYLIGYEE